MIRSLLIVLAMLVGTTACAQDALPQFVMALSDADYARWAAWQNRQSKLRAAEEAENSYEEPYVYSSKTATSVDGGLTAAILRLDKARRSKSGSTRRAATTRTQSDWRNIETETWQQRYVNPDYTPPGAVTIHNPYARFAKPVEGRVPNWDKLFVPCPDGTMTVTEALAKFPAPVSPEKFYSLIMSEWLK